MEKKSTPADTIFPASRSHHVWIAFRDYRPGLDPSINALTTMLTGSSVCHVELVFQKPCPRSKKCPYHSARNCSARAADKKEHLVSYSITGSGAYQLFDRQFRKEGVWSFYLLDGAINASARVEMERFLVWHVKRAAFGYNFAGFYLNFFTPTEIGLKFDPWVHRTVAQRREHLYRERAWFCSELIAAALMVAGLPVPTMPCKTTPSFLLSFVVKNRFGEFYSRFSVAPDEFLVTILPEQND